MQITLCTIGFTGKSAEEFFRLLEQAGVKKVIDIRENRIGQLSGFAKYPDIEFFLNRMAGICYAHRPELAPAPEIRKAYRATKDWPAYEAAFLRLMKERGILAALDAAQFEQTAALLCSEPRPENCHRRLLADLFAEHWRAQGHAVEIRHLVLDRPVNKSRKRNKTS